MEEIKAIEKKEAVEQMVTVKCDDCGHKFDSNPYNWTWGEDSYPYPPVCPECGSTETNADLSKVLCQKISHKMHEKDQACVLSQMVKSVKMKEAIREMSSKSEVTFDEYRTFVRGGVTMDEFLAMGHENVEKLLKHGSIIVFDDVLDAGQWSGDATGVPDVYFRSPRDENGQFAIGCRR